MRMVLPLVVCVHLSGGSAAIAQVVNKDDEPCKTALFASKTPMELAKLLESKDVEVRWKAAVALYNHRWNASPAIAALTNALKDPDPYVRSVAAGCFRFLGPPVGDPREAIPLLANLLVNDKKPWVRAASAVSLRTITWIDKG